MSALVPLPETPPETSVPPSGAGNLALWLLGSLLLAAVLGVASGMVPARLRLFYLFPIVQGLVTAELADRWLRGLLAVPRLRWSPLWLTFLALLSVGLGGWQAAQVWQKTLPVPQPTLAGALARQMVDQMPPEVEGYDAETKSKLIAELETGPTPRGFRGWLRARAGRVTSPWPELLFGSEMLVAAVVVGLRAARRGTLPRETLAEGAPAT